MSPPEPSRPQRAALLSTEGPDALLERAVGAVTREALSQLTKGGSTRGLWVAVVILTCAYGAHILFGDNLTTRLNRTEDLVVWLVECKLAEQKGQQCDPLPLGIRQERP